MVSLYTKASRNTIEILLIDTPDIQLVYAVPLEYSETQHARRFTESLLNRRDILLVRQIFLSVQYLRAIVALFREDETLSLRLSFRHLNSNSAD